MEAYNRSNRAREQYKNAGYIDGSAARKITALSAYPKRQEPERREPVRPRERERIQEKPAKRPAVRRGIDFFTMSILSAAIAMTVYMCVSYLQVQADLIQLDKGFVALEGELKDVRDKNNSIEAGLNQAIDFDYVYNVAVGELGMVFPNHNEVIQYEWQESSYVRQYEDLPEVKVGTVLDKLFR